MTKTEKALILAIVLPFIFASIGIVNAVQVDELKTIEACGRYDYCPEQEK